ncbi:ST1E1-like protein [Mya arenaria]|uniref:ST1E1-like protein n=1 Tax=Mya arenaria TaxID=6604 RepID=A0ABY7E470_MYAAR|nr:ST1E1-like protein [Mya arenaria]
MYVSKHFTMSVMSISDVGGDHFNIVDFGEFKSSLFGKSLECIKELNAKLPDFKFRDGDILLASYPKTGCAWTYEILTMLLAGRAVKPDHGKMDSMLEANLPADIDRQPSPRNTMHEVKRLADFLGVSYADELLEEISGKCQFKEMQNRYDKDMMGKYKDEVNYGFLRKGEVGDWKRWFTVAMSEEYDAHLQQHLAGSMFQFKYAL